MNTFMLFLKIAGILIASIIGGIQLFDGWKKTTENRAWCRWGIVIVFIVGVTCAIGVQMYDDFISAKVEVNIADSLNQIKRVATRMHNITIKAKFSVSVMPDVFADYRDFACRTIPNVIREERPVAYIGEGFTYAQEFYSPGDKLYEPSRIWIPQESWLFPSEENSKVLGLMVKDLVVDVRFYVKETRFPVEDGRVKGNFSDDLHVTTDTERINILYRIPQQEIEIERTGIILFQNDPIMSFKRVISLEDLVGAKLLVCISSQGALFDIDQDRPPQDWLKDAVLSGLQLTISGNKLTILGDRVNKLTTVKDNDNWSDNWIYAFPETVEELEDLLIPY